MSMTALQIVQQACLELGLPPPVALTATENETSNQMLGLLNAAGYDLISNYQWEEMNRTYKFEIGADPLKDTYDLPVDYNYFLDCTGWDRTNRWPLLGPTTQQEWQALIAAKVQAVSRTYWIIQNKKISFWPYPLYPVTADPVTPQGNRTIAISYSSLSWVENGLQPGQYLNMIINDSDKPVLSDWLLVKFLKVKMWNAKGFDTAPLVTEFKVLFDSLSGKSKGSRVLSLAPKTGTVFIGVQNVPEGNWIR